MPEPANCDSKDEFAWARIPVALDEGTAESPDQAAAISNSMWEERAMKSENGETRGSGDSLLRIQRVASVDRDSGSFGMTLATEGEASDGHILSVEGAVIPERIPMQLSHWNEPEKTVGSVTRMRRHLNEEPKRLSALGIMELDGDGAGVELRRDLMHMIARGHVGAVSVRWDFDWKDVTPRSKLPNDHPHYVNADRETDARKRSGLFFKRWRPTEGSIVAVGADPKALIGRARETSGKISDFWAEMARDAEAADASGIVLAAPTDSVAIGKPTYPDLAGLVAAFATHVRELGVEVEHLVKLGVPYRDLAEIFDTNKPAPPVEELTVQVLKRLDALEQKLERAEHGRVSGEPSTPPSVSALLRETLREIREEQKQQNQDFRRRILEIQGRVRPQA